jgi:hypothetical protein
MNNYFKHSIFSVSHVMSSLSCFQCQKQLIYKNLELPKHTDFHFLKLPFFICLLSKLTSSFLHFNYAGFNQNDQVVAKRHQHIKWQKGKIILQLYRYVFYVSEKTKTHLVGLCVVFRMTTTSWQFYFFPDQELVFLPTFCPSFFLQTILSTMMSSILFIL